METRATVPPLNITFLDQVDGDAEATVRFSIPTYGEGLLRNWPTSTAHRPSCRAPP